MAKAVQTLAAVLLLLTTTAVMQGSDIVDDEQAAIVAAVDRVAPAVVRIETIGGLERVGEVLFGSGPTTGLVVDPKGYIITSAFNFLNNPTSILVRLPDGTRKSAKIVATDHSRMLVLLKIEPDEPLPTCDVAGKKDMRVGQWTIAVGRAFENDRPNMAVGILSAIDRVWGKAIQTDAAVSPNNYGGPLIDIHGRVLGVLSPLSPEKSDEMAGYQWYDSGIGFAVPMEDIQKVLDRLEKGEDLHGGIAGIGMKGPNLFSAEPVILSCHPKGPAAVAGIKPGDRIVAIDGRPVVRTAQVKQEIERRYAGDKMQVAVMRGDKRIESELVLAAKLEPFQTGFLGILPMRDSNDAGVVVRYVYPDSPAAAAGLAPGDVIHAVNGKPVKNRLELRAEIGNIEPGAKVDLDVKKDSADRKIKAVLSALPEGLPPDQLPDAIAPSQPNEPKAAEGPKLGAVSLKIPEFPNEAWAYVPENYQPGVPHGLLVWLHSAAGYDWADILARWKPLCDRYGLILLAPKSMDGSRWMPGEVMVIDRFLAMIASTYEVDPTRIVLHGHEGGGAMAFLTAFRNPETITGIAAVEALPVGQPPDNSADHRLAIYLAASGKSRVARGIEPVAAALRQKKLPVTVKPLGDVPRYLNADEMAEFARWIDMLDRI